MKTPTEWKTIFEGLTFSEGGDTFERFIEAVQRDAIDWACMKVFGMCSSDNVAQRTVNAIRKGMKS